ncbi:hypothetical protein AB0F77_22335 [Streptomyces sp. NPDC026672]|uniref:hypothetical protein n=1 Tax=unclassified Streptomyces TaxID=2593676 RepID=UPI0033C94FAC
MTCSIDPPLTPALAVLPAIDVHDPETARATEHAILSELPAPPLHDLTVEERRVPEPDAAPDVDIRIYRPRHASQPLPGILKIHGGGFVTGGLDTDHAAAAALASSRGRLGRLPARTGTSLPRSRAGLLRSPHLARGLDRRAGH